VKDLESEIENMTEELGQKENHLLDYNNREDQFLNEV
jgi:hypothetical protein